MDDRDRCGCRDQYVGRDRCGDVTGVGDMTCDVSGVGGSG